MLVHHLILFFDLFYKGQRFSLLVIIAFTQPELYMYPLYLDLDDAFLVVNHQYIVILHRFFSVWGTCRQKIEITYSSFLQKCIKTQRCPSHKFDFYPLSTCNPSDGGDNGAGVAYRSQQRQSSEDKVHGATRRPVSHNRHGRQSPRGGQSLPAGIHRRSRGRPEDSRPAALQHPRLHGERCPRALYRTEGRVQQRVHI